MLNLLASLALSVAVVSAPDVTVDMDSADQPAATASASHSADSSADTEETESSGSSFSRALSGAGVNPFTAMQKRLNGKWDFLTDPRALNDVLKQVHIVWAAIFFFIGGMCVTNGYRWHRGVIVLLAAILGIYAGTLLGGAIGSTNVVAACVAVLFAVVAWPMMRYSVALFGGLAGAFAGANVWTACGFPAAQHQYGAVIGLTLVGMLAFIAFRGVVILLTSIGGATMVVLGALAALMQVDSWQSAISGAISANRLLVPFIVASAAAIGIVYQFGGGMTGLNAMATKADPALKKKAAA